MTDGNSIDYYRAREKRELALSREAANPKVADIHRQMAGRYAELIVLASVSRYMEVISLPRHSVSA